MVLSQTFSFIYNAQTVGLSAERENLKGPFILTALVTWKYKDNLNKINELTVTVFKSDIDRSKIFFEREVIVPAFDFRGLITGLTDINDSILQITMHERAWHLTRRLYKIADSLKEYNLVLVSPSDLATFVQPVLDSANTDMPFTWVLGEDIPATSDFNFDIKWKTYYEVLRLIAVHSLNDLWFEENKVYIGTKGKSITLDRDDKIYEKLKTNIDLDTYGNIVNVVGAEFGGVNLHTNIIAAQTDLLYNYERVVSDNNLKSQASVDGVASRILEDFDSITPDVKIEIRNETIQKYNMQSGDIIKIISNSETQTVKGFFRLISVVASNSRSLIKLQFSKTGKFIPRISDSLDILEATLIKLHDIELNS